MDSELSFPDVAINICKPANPIEVPIVDSRIATRSPSPNFVRHITFDLTGTPLAGKFVPGQSIGIIPEGTERNGKPAKVRLYSVSSSSNGEDGNPNYVATTVKRVIDEDWETQDLFLGLCSNYLAKQRKGDRVRITGPSGKRFLLPSQPELYNYIFFATGTGIAPFRGMIMDLMEKKTTGSIVVVFGCAYNTDVLYSDYFTSLMLQQPKFHYLTAVSREDKRPDGSKVYVQSKIQDNAEILHPLLQASNTLIYICGLKGMETGIYKNLATEGFSEYLHVKEPLVSKNPEEWTSDEIKKMVKPGQRILVETY